MNNLAHIHLIIETVLAVVIVVLLIALYRWPRLKASMSVSGIETPAKPPRYKCHVVTYAYADRSRIERHTLCQHLDLKTLTEDYGRSLHKESPLVECIGSAHYMET